MTANRVQTQHVTRTHAPDKPFTTWAFSCSCGYHSTGYLNSNAALNGARLHRTGLA